MHNSPTTRVTIIIHTHTHTTTHTDIEREHKKVVKVELQEPDIKNLNSEMTDISKTQHQKNFNHFIRRLKRSDLNHSQVAYSYIPSLAIQLSRRAC